MKSLTNNSTRARSPSIRRGSVLVFVLGVLTLLALVGLVLLTRTHGEAKRVTNEAASTSASGVLGGIVHAVQETLRRDIWGTAPALPLLDRPLADDLPIGSAQNLFGLFENNEAFDAPGAGDRWLASTTAYMGANEDPVNIDPINNPRRVTARDATNAPIGYEDKVLAWPYVSYLGSDINLPLAAPDPATVNPYMWPLNTRRPALGQLVRYGPSNLENVEILQTPPPLTTAPFAYDSGGFALQMIPGSTTNVPIARARSVWNAVNWTAVLPAPPLNVVPKFPYFDTNADGQVDLYDADGDGVPDSPLSLVIPVDVTSPDDPRTLYAAIRIVDHGSMLNVNVASSLRLPTGLPSQLMFDESIYTLQRRGQRATELLLDEVVNPADRFERTKAMVAIRSGNDPVAHDFDVVRSKLLGHLQSTGGAYSLFGLADEASLRNRGVLVPYDHRTDAAIAGDFRAIDRALPSTMLWTREVDAAGNYNGIEGRWNRFNSNIVDSGPTGGFEGYDSGSCGPPVLAGCRRGWRSLMREDEPYALRRRLFTTISKDVAPTPDIVKGIVPPLPNVSPIDLRLQQLWALGMDWPTLISTTSALATLPARPTSAFTDKFLVVPERIPPDWARPQQIDLNMSDPANPLEAKAAMVRYAAAAVYLALDGVASYQGIELVENPGTVGDDGLNREYLAWQFALNLVDYRDGDNEPSMAEWPVGSGRLLFGLEKQPFFTEAIASVVVGTGAGPIGPVPEEPPTSPDQWFHAVELYVPPYWQIPIVNLSLRPPGSGTGDIPLSTFVPALTAPALGSVLTGGPDGRYYIFCGPTTFAPGSITSSASFIANSYRNNAFRISSDPSDDRSVELVYSTSGGVGPETHALDVIGANYAGGEGAGTGCPGGSSEWATKGTTPTTGQRITTSLRRSTKGWRFDVAAHIAGREGPIAVEDPCSGFEETLGRANEFMASGSLDSRLPEVPWPGRALLLGGEPVDTFLASQPYSAFDTVGEISRIPMLGHIRKPPGVDTPVLDGLGLTGQELIPMSALIERIISRPSITGLPTALPERMAVGHPDFAEFGTINPWARRLVDFFTTSSHLFDGVDNDGDGVIDLRNGDATEGIDVVNAIAGRVNLNTAPATVLRAVPYLSFLPSSTEYLDMEPGAGNHAADFVSVTNAGRFWDLSTAIVAARENREVPLRLWNSAAESMQVVANAIPSGGARTFANVADITGLSLVTDNSALPNAENRLYRYDRFADAPTSAAPLRLQNHKIVALDPDLGAQDPFSPDFRFKRLVGGDGIIDYSAIAPTLPVPPGYVPDNAGIRARDILLARASGSTTTRSDVFTAYIALIDEEGHYVARSQVTLDRSECFREDPESTVYTVNGVRLMVMPRVLEGSGRWGSYENESR